MFRYSKKLVRKKLGHFMLEAQVAPFVITRKGSDEVVVMSYTFFEELLEDSEEIADIRAAEISLSDPRPSIPWEEIKKEYEQDAACSDPSEYDRRTQ